MDATGFLETALLVAGLDFILHGVWNHAVQSVHQGCVMRPAVTVIVVWSGSMGIGVMFYVPLIVMEVAKEQTATAVIANTVGMDPAAMLDVFPNAVVDAIKGKEIVLNVDKGSLDINVIRNAQTIVKTISVTQQTEGVLIVKLVFGPSCDEKCNTNCDDSDCNFITGECYSCKLGFYGKFCNISSPVNCQGNCDERGNCYNCKLGYYKMTAQLLVP